VPVPSWRFPEEEGYVGPGYDLIRDKTNAELHTMSSADRDAMILAVHGSISTNPDHVNYPNYHYVVFPDWQFVLGGYVLPADWDTNPVYLAEGEYLDGDDYGMGNIVLKKMKDENGNAIAVDWAGSNAGPIAQSDFINYTPQKSNNTYQKLPISSLIGNDIDSDWRILNPHARTFWVHSKYGALNQTPRNNMLFVVNMDQPRYGKLAPGTQNYTYYAPDGFFGIDTYRYHVADLTGKDKWETAYIFVGIDVDPTLVNFVPEAVDDEFTVPRGESTLLDVLTNDTDPEGGSLSIVKIGYPERNTDVGNPHLGIAEIVDGQILYTADEFFTGTDRFVYYAMDDAGNMTRRGMVSVHVEKSDVISVNNSPEAVDDNTVTNQETAVIVNVLTNDSDSDGDALSVVGATNGVSGSTIVNADGTITYTPDVGFFGDDSFSYTISDGNGGEATAVVSVTINTNEVSDVSDDDLVVEYTFEDGTATDSSPHGADNSGTLQNGATIVSGVLTLDGVDDVVIIADSSDINDKQLTQQRTISLSFNANNVSGRQMLYEEGGGSGGLNIYIDNSLLYVGGWNTKTNNWNGTFLLTAVNAGEWHTVTLTLDGTKTIQNGAFRGYLNGELFGSGAGSEIAKHGGDVRLGGLGKKSLFHDGMVEGIAYFGGQIDNLRIYNRTLSVSEVAQLSEAL